MKGLKDDSNTRLSSIEAEIRETRDTLNSFKLKQEEQNKLAEETLIKEQERIKELEKLNKKNEEKKEIKEEKKEDPPTQSQKAKVSNPFGNLVKKKIEVKSPEPPLNQTLKVTGIFNFAIFRA